MIDCCLCGQPIEPDPNGWDKGHNARPVKEGQCCLKCNNDTVVPRRMALLMDPNVPKTFVRLGDLIETDEPPTTKES